MLRVDRIETYYGDIKGLFGMSLRVEEGEMVALLGRNGMGKTTTVRSVMGLAPARTGDITFRGRSIRTQPPYRIARLGVGYVPEGRQIFPNLTVRENLLATANARLNGASSWTLERVHAMFPALRDRAGHLGCQISGGEQQMLAIGRALMTNPALLILDEAAEGLAPKIRDQIWQRLSDLKASGLSILIIDKDVQALTRICDRHYIVEKGRTVWEGTSAELKNNPAVQKECLGV